MKMKDFKLFLETERNILAGTNQSNIAILINQKHQYLRQLAHLVLGNSMTILTASRLLLEY